MLFCIIWTVNCQPQLCARGVEYSECSNTASLAIAQCSANVKDVPDQVYYECLCNGNEQLVKCYDVCPDDPQLQLQMQSQKATVFSTCQTAKEFKKALVASSATSTRIVSSTRQLETSTQDSTKSSTTIAPTNSLQIPSTRKVTATPVPSPRKETAIAIPTLAPWDSASFAYTLVLAFVIVLGL
jgi:hypothetical protein